MRNPPSAVAAPAAWRTVDFVSDVHLHPEDPATHAGFVRYLEQTPADAVFLLGDIFEVWVGDDAATPGSFEAGIAAHLRRASATRALFFLHGNRDFLMGEGFLCAAGVTLLDDPCLLQFHGRRWLLSHGDSLCLGDTDYQRFRARVRDPAWQAAVLAKPLDERQALGRTMRQASESHKAADTDYADADLAMTEAWLTEADATTLIHGHTHRPADHALPGGGTRIVLSDWDLQAMPPRAEALRISADGSVRRVVAT